MHESTKNRLIESARSIEKLRSLPKSELEWIYPLLNRGIQTSLDLLDIIADEPKTFEEIAYLLSCSAETVSQKLNALVVGGLGIDLTETTAYLPTGRPRKLVRR